MRRNPPPHVHRPLGPLETRVSDVNKMQSFSLKRGNPPGIIDAEFEEPPKMRTTYGRPPVPIEEVAPNGRRDVARAEIAMVEEKIARLRKSKGRPRSQATRVALRVYTQWRDAIRRRFEPSQVEHLMQIDRDFFSPTVGQLKRNLPDWHHQTTHLLSVEAKGRALLLHLIESLGGRGVLAMAETKVPRTRSAVAMARDAVAHSSQPVVVGEYALDEGIRVAEELARKWLRKMGGAKLRRVK